MFFILECISYECGCGDIHELMGVYESIDAAKAAAKAAEADYGQWCWPDSLVITAYGSSWGGQYVPMFEHQAEYTEHVLGEWRMKDLRDVH